MNTTPLASAAVALLFPVLAFASSSGIAGVDPNTGCNQCHSGGSTPTVTLTPPTGPIQPGQTVPLTVSISATNKDSSNVGYGGFNLEASNGTLSAPTSDAMILSGEATHSAPKQEAAGFITFVVNWTAPATAQAVTFTAWGNSVNFNGSNTGDRAAKVTSTCGRWYLDADSDGFGGNTAVVSCTQPAGYVAATGDCNDGNAQVHPGATEVCNGADDDCDAFVDDNASDALTFYADVDGDGFGNPASTRLACTAPAGYVTDNTDCNDASASVNPSGTEVCNGVDDDCDGMVDDNATGTTTFYADADGDGFGDPSQTTQACSLPTGYAANSMDCDDGAGDVHPGASETCNGVDEDCDGLTDDGVPNSTCGVGICARSGTTCEAASCSPGAPGTETCNGLDDDCDGVIDNDPDALCPGAEVCNLDGVCALPPEDAGTDAGTGADAGISNEDAGTSSINDGGSHVDDEEPPGGCGCGATNGSMFGLFALVFLAAAGSRRRARAVTGRR